MNVYLFHLPEDQVGGEMLVCAPNEDDAKGLVEIINMRDTPGYFTGWVFSKIMSNLSCDETRIMVIFCNRYIGNYGQ